MIRITRALNFGLSQSRGRTRADFWWYRMRSAAGEFGSSARAHRHDANVNTMKNHNEEMREEYDFSKAVRGKHARRTLRIVGDKCQPERASSDLAAKIQKKIERDLKGRAGFNTLWNKLDGTTREEIRAAWLKTITELLRQAEESRQ